MAERFNLNEKETEGLVGELLSKGYIEPADNGMYRLTLKGNALSIARCMAPINREKADRIMQEFLKRVEEVNRDDFYPYRVSKLVLFGSYLNPEQMDLGDIDIAFELEPKIKDYDELMRHIEAVLFSGESVSCFFPFRMRLWLLMVYNGETEDDMERYR